MEFWHWLFHECPQPDSASTSDIDPVDSLSDKLKTNSPVKVAVKNKKCNWHEHCLQRLYLLSKKSGVIER